MIRTASTEHLMYESCTNTDPARWWAGGGQTGCGAERGAVPSVVTWSVPQAGPGPRSVGVLSLRCFVFVACCCHRGARRVPLALRWGWVGLYPHSVHSLVGALSTSGVGMSGPPGYKQTSLRARYCSDTSQTPRTLFSSDTVHETVHLYICLHNNKSTSSPRLPRDPHGPSTWHWALLLHSLLSLDYSCGTAL
jgi:hypothetical protein